MFFNVVLKGKSSGIRCTTYMACMFQTMIWPLMTCHMTFNRIQRCKWTITNSANKRFCVTIFMACQLDGRFKSFWTKWALVSPYVRVRHQMVVINGVCFISGKEKQLLFSLLELSINNMNLFYIIKEK